MKEKEKKIIVKKNFTDEEFEEMWREAKEREARDIKEWNALPEEEKKQIRELRESGFGQRATEDITGDHDNEY